MEGLQPAVVGETPLCTASNGVHKSLLDHTIASKQSIKKHKIRGISIETLDISEGVQQGRPILVRTVTMPRRWTRAKTLHARDQGGATAGLMASTANRRSSKITTMPLATTIAAP